MWKHKWKVWRDSLPSTSMRLRLILAFALFTIAAISILWVLQTFFMDELYEAVKYQELSRCAERLEKSLGTDTLEADAFDLTPQYNVCLSVYQIHQGTGSLLTEQHSRMFCLLPMLSSPAQLSALYQSALQAEN